MSDSIARLNSALAGRYIVQREAGEGGMARVYLAEDVKHGRRVALKVLKPELAAQVGAERFLAEIRTTANLQHPHILPLFDSGEADGFIYYVMPFVEGETLREYLDRVKQLPVDEAVRIARAIAAALQSAHDHGVVHRDIKPANILLSSGEPLVMDFGIALGVEGAGDTRMTETGLSLGSPRYMSPEQATGDQKVMANSDVYALGCVLYEMLLGEPPHVGSTTRSILTKVLTEAPRSPRELRASIPPHVDAAVLRALQKIPADRFGSAGDFRRALADPDATSDTQSVSSTRRAPVVGRGALVSVGAVAATLVVAFLWVVSARQDESPRKYVAVLPFTSGEPADEVVAAGLTHSLTAMITGLGTAEDSLWVVPSREISGRGVVTASDATRLFPVNLALSGHVQRVEGVQEVVLELMDPDPDALRVLASSTVPGPGDPTFQDTAAMILSEMLGIGPAPSEQDREGDQEAAAASARAFPFYVQARGYLTRLYDRGSLQNTVGLFERALAEDPSFAQAHAGLCEALWEQYTDTRQPELARRSTDACDRAATLAGDALEVLVAVGATYLRTGETDRAEATLERALELHPSDADVHRWLGRVHEERAEIEAAADAYRTAIRLRPDVWTYHDDLAILLVYNDRLEEAAQAFRQVTLLSPDNYVGFNGLGLVSMWSGEREEAERMFRVALEKGSTSLANRNLAYLRLRGRRYQEAVEEARRALDRSPTDWWAMRWTAHAMHGLGDQAGERSAWERLIALASPALEVNPRDLGVLVVLAEAHIALGRVDLGRAYFERALELPVPWTYMRQNRARVHEMLGEREAAIEQLGLALKAGFDRSAFEEDLWLDTLREDPRWSEMLQSVRR
jgi:tetratricopeptide (TPR) repeat protein/tRNA A-37 threonylcarbamoyl transferase component Bud32